MAFIETKNLKKYFKTPKGMLHAVDDVNISIEKGKTLGVVGESGCGKSTLGRVVLNLLEPTSGQVFIDDQEMYKLHGAAQKTMRMRAQMIFQDPYSSLNPRMSVSEIIAEPLIANKLMTDKRGIRILENHLCPVQLRFGRCDKRTASIWKIADGASETAALPSSQPP